MAGNDRLMDPGASPGTVGVRRLNRLPLYLVGAALLGFVLIVALVAVNRARQPAAGSDRKQGGGGSEQLARHIAAAGTGMVPAATPPKPPELPKPEEPKPAPVPAPKPPDLVVPIAHPDLDRPPPPPRDEEAARIREAKIHLFEEAVKAKTRLRMETEHGSPPAGPNPAPARAYPEAGDDTEARLAEARQRVAERLRENPTEAFRSRIRQIREDLGAAGQAPATDTAAPREGEAHQGEFARFEGGTGRWRLGNTTEAPPTPYLIRTGDVLPGTLLSGINSDLAGQIMAQVGAHVYDTPTGKHLLIPQGSRLVGTYDNRVAYGQSRVLIAWQRIIFPDGKALDIGAMPGADGAGYAGFADQVNHHFVRIFGSALMMSLITGGISYSQNQNQQTNPQGFSYQQSASGTLSASLGQQLGMATAAMIQKNLNISPTVEIRPGYRFNVMVAKDLAFETPYQAFDWMRGETGYRPASLRTGTRGDN